MSKMNIGSIKLVYFSPTRTTKQIVEGIAKGIRSRSIEHIDLTYPSANSLEFIEFYEELVIIGVPVYGGRIPVDAVSRLRRLKADETPAVIVVIYGNREYEDALLELRDLASETGFKPVAGGAFIGEHSYNTVETPIASGRPDVEDLKKAMDFGRKIQEKLGEIVRSEDMLRLQVPGNYPYRERDQHPQAIAPITVEERCVKCGRCAEVCPTAAIILDTLVITEEDTCIYCCACVKNCPASARVMEHPWIRKIAKWLSTDYSVRKEPEIYM